MKPTAWQVVSVVISLVLGTAFVIVAHNFSDELANTKSAFSVRQAFDTATSRVAGCGQYNDQQDSVVAGDEQGAAVLIAVLAAGHHTPDLDTRITAALGEYRHTIEAHHPHRDCSPGGIDKFFGLAPGSTSAALRGTP